MPPRPAAARPPAIPEWSALLLRPSAASATAARKLNASAPRAQRPSTLSEALVRFVDRNWD